MSSEKDKMMQRIKSVSNTLAAAQNTQNTNTNDLYKDLPERINTLLGEDKHLHQLKQLSDARMAFIEEHKLTSRDRIPTQKFSERLSDRWGIKLKSDDATGGLMGFDVIDEQKFLLFQMVFP